MTSFERLVSSFFLCAAALCLITSSNASAQVRPTPVPTSPTRPADKKPAGVAEKAPSKPDLMPTTPVIPPPRAEKKKFQAFRLDGYFRFRGDWFKNFNLGFSDDVSMGGAPFREPLACKAGGTADKPCEQTLKSSNIRLRLEPTIAVGEDAKVFMQIDVLDNLVLGSTPNGKFGDGTPVPTNIPISGFSDSQVDPQAGRNSDVSSIRVKRAWAEVMTAFGLLKFGRQPSNWGMGIFANGGGKDPIHGTYDYDADYGDTVDRVLFGTIIPGTDYKIALAMDWGSTAPTAAQSDIFRNRYNGQAWDLDDNDDVNDWIIAITRMDSPGKFQDIVDQGDLALNYGGYFVYRTQSWDYNPANSQGGSPDPARFVKRDAKAYIPDFWFHLGYRKLSLEGEVIAIVGNIGNLTDVGVSESLDVRQLGFVLTGGYKLLEDKLKFDFEVGYASGDQWDNEPQGVTNVRDARSLVDDPNDTTVSAFRFDFDYKIDLILFRELIGTVTNTTYLRPQVGYDVTKGISVKLQSVIAFANKPVATPGNGSLYGVEFDVDIGYRSDGFFAGIAYGFFIPGGAMDHPDSCGSLGGPEFPYGCTLTDTTNNVGSAGNAQTIQTRMVLKF